MFDQIPQPATRPGSAGRPPHSVAGWANAAGLNLKVTIRAKLRPDRRTII